MRMGGGPPVPAPAQPVPLLPNMVPRQGALQAEDATTPPPPPPKPPVPTSTAADLPPEAKSFLDTLASPESSNRYDIRYGTKGDVPFVEGTDHPNIPEKTAGGKTSTAAGRYQITKETWDEYSRRYPDLTEGGFTRENQDQVAWQLAQNRYKATTGRELGTDLQYGRTGDVEPALKATWPAGAKEFAKRFNPPRQPATLVASAGERSSP